MDLSSLSTQLEQQIMRVPSSYSPPEDMPNDNDGNNERSIDREQEIIIRPGICVPHELSAAEYDDIRRCFKRANLRAEGYLDSKELKVYMDLRKCPITSWEAEKILEYADPKYNYYISLEQVLNLATYFGIGTPHPLRLTRSEFEISIKNSFRPNRGTSTLSTSCPVNQSNSVQNFDFESVVNYFESKASGTSSTDYNRADTKEDDDDDDYFEPKIIDHRTSVDIGVGTDSIESYSSPRTVDASTSSTKTELAVEIQSKNRIVKTKNEMGIQTHAQYSAKEIANFAFPTKNSVETDISEERYVDDEPLESVRAIKEKWENKIQELIDNNADDFLVKLNEQKKMLEKIVGKANLPKTDYTDKRPNKASIPPVIPKISKRLTRQTQFPSKSNIMMELNPPTVQSLFRRNTSPKKNNTTVEPKILKNTKFVDGGSQTISTKKRNVQIKKASKSSNTVASSPPLPPPIIPELPKEWKSSSHHLQFNNS